MHALFVSSRDFFAVNNTPPVPSSVPLIVALQSSQVSAHPAFLDRTFPLLPSNCGRAQEPSEVLVHNERDACPRQNSHQVGAQPSVKSAKPFLGKGALDASSYCGVQMSRRIVLLSCSALVL